MVKKRQNGQTRQSRPWLFVVAWGAAGVATLFSSGCSHQTTNVSQPHDPLHGILAPPGLPQPTNSPNGAPASTPAATQTYNSGNPYASPASSNPATLAGTSWTGPAGRTLAINDTGPPFLPGQLTSGSKSQERPLGPNANPKVVQVPDVSPTSTAQPQVLGPQHQRVPPDLQAASATRQPTEEILSRQLQNRGIVNQKQEVLPDGLRLTCYLSRGPGAGLRILEVTAADYTAAAQAIMQQLDISR